MADVMVVKGVVERDGDAAGVAEEAVYAFAGEAFEEHFGSGHQFAGFDPFGGGRLCDVSRHDGTP